MFTLFIPHTRLISRTYGRIRNALMKAETLDSLLLQELDITGRKRLSVKYIKEEVLTSFPKAEYIGKGAAKVVFRITFNGEHDLALKVVKQPERMPRYIRPYDISGNSQKERNHSFVKHYFATQTCILTRYADPINIHSPIHLEQVRKLRRKYKHTHSDLRYCNFGLVDGKVKILDAGRRK